MWSNATRILQNKQFLSFLLVGAFSAGVNILSRVILNTFLGYETSIVLAYLCGMTTAYVLNRAFVFDAMDVGVLGSYLRFALINVVALVQVILVSVGLADYIFPALKFTWHAETVAHVCGVALPTITSYLGHKYFSFAQHGPKPNSKKQVVESLTDGSGSYK
jgi:putative flippase GtrA